MRKFIVGSALGMVVCFQHACFGELPRNVILFIGDGMGFEQVKAAGLYLHGETGTLSFESFPHAGAARTAAADAKITDSAASGTAMATGVKVNNGVISMAIPGDGRELETALEHWRRLGRSVGLVTTTAMTHATPAAFGAHEPSRANADQIARDYLDQTRPDVLLGGGGIGMSPDAAREAGYTVVTDRAGLLALDTDAVARLSGQFGESHLPYVYDGCDGTLPRLPEMTATALAILGRNPEGFFLMVEGGRIDHAGHENHIERNVIETVEFDAAVREALEWTGSREDTLIVVTADHETGGLSVVEGRGQGQFPAVTWSTGNHTDADVPVYATGPNSESVTGVFENTGIFDILLGRAPSAAETRPVATVAAGIGRDGAESE